MKNAFIVIGFLVTANALWATQWQITTVDAKLDSVAQRYTSIAVDASGYPDISYCTKDSLKYAHWNGSSWDMELITGINGTSNSLAYGGNTPYIAFKSNIGGNLCCAVKTGKSWTIQVVDTNNANSSPAIVGFGYPSIAIGLDGYPRIAYEAYWTYGSGGFDYGADLRCATYTPDSGWKVETAWNPPPHGDGSFGGDYAAIAIDSKGNIHISHQLAVNAYSVTLCYTVKNAGVWQTTEGGLDGNWMSGPASGYFTSIAIDSLGSANISYILSEGASYYLRHIMPGNKPDEIGLTKKAPTAIVMDRSTNYPIIAYGKSDATLGYAVWGGSSWSVETVDANRNTGNGVSFCMHNGVPHISYADEGNRYLKYATKDVGAESQPKLAEAELSVSPNPSFLKFHIKAGSQGKNFELKLYDAGGRLIKILHRGNESLWERDETLSIPGIYFITLNGERSIVTKKLIVMGK